MTKNIFQQILNRAIILSPIITALTAAPFYIVYSLPFGLFLVLWIMLTLGMLLWWGIQTLLFSCFKKNKYANWQYGIALTIVTILFVFLTKDSVGKVAISLNTYTPTIAFLLRFTVVAGINIIIYLLLDLIYTRENSVQLVKKNAALEYQNLETEYKLLKEQINPHFLFNALNISKSLIKTQPKNAEKYILNLSDFLRRTLKNPHKSISLQEELDHCLQFVELRNFKDTDVSNPDAGFAMNGTKIDLYTGRFINEKITYNGTFRYQTYETEIADLIETYNTENPDATFTGSTEDWQAYYFLAGISYKLEWSHPAILLNNY